jgi:hypothetical protein
MYVKDTGDTGCVPIGIERLLWCGKSDAGKDSNGGHKGRRYW